MKRSHLLVLIVLIISPDLKGQDALESTFLSLSYNNNQAGSIFKRPVGDMFSPDAPSFSIGIEKYLSGVFNVTGNLSRGEIMSDGSSVCSITGLDVGLKYKFNQYGSTYSGSFNPYFTINAGMTHFHDGPEMQDQTVFSFRPELGVDMALSEKLRLSFSAAYNTNQKQKYRAYSVGLGFSIARKKDSDKDGIIDKLDRCPNEKGFSYNEGCPHDDSDNDGVIDAYDLCPYLPGSLEGCPDTDNDGIADHEDQCPDHAGGGSDTGCPATVMGNETSEELSNTSKTTEITESMDAQREPLKDDHDRDWVPAEMDACPLLKGNASNQGCPFYLTDYLAQAEIQLKGEGQTLPEEAMEVLKRIKSYMQGSEFAIQVSVVKTGQSVTISGIDAVEKVRKYLTEEGINAQRIVLNADEKAAVSNGANSGLKISFALVKATKR